MTEIDPSYWEPPDDPDAEDRFFDAFADAVHKAASAKENERFDAPGCQMCGVSPDDPCDCHDPQGEENER